MRETNFKCMYLIDHNLYKKAIINNNINSSYNNNINNNNINSSYDYNTTYLSSEYLGSDTNLSSKEFKCSNNNHNSDMNNTYTDPSSVKDVEDKTQYIKNTHKEVEKKMNDVNSQVLEDKPIKVTDTEIEKKTSLINNQNGYTNPNSTNTLPDSISDDNCQYMEISSSNDNNQARYSNSNSTNTLPDSMSDDNCQCMEISSTNDTKKLLKTGKVLTKRKYDKIYNKIDHPN